MVTPKARNNYSQATSSFCLTSNIPESTLCHRHGLLQGLHCNQITVFFFSLESMIQLNWFAKEYLEVMSRARLIANTSTSFDSFSTCRSPEAAKRGILVLLRTPSITELPGLISPAKIHQFFLTTHRNALV